MTTFTVVFEAYSLGYVYLKMDCNIPDLFLGLILLDLVEGLLSFYLLYPAASTFPHGRQGTAAHTFS